MLITGQQFLSLACDLDKVTQEPFTQYARKAHTECLLPEQYATTLSSCHLCVSILEPISGRAIPMCVKAWFGMHSFCDISCAHDIIDMMLVLANSNDDHDAFVAD